MVSVSSKEASGRRNKGDRFWLEDHREAWQQLVLNPCSELVFPVSLMKSKKQPKAWHNESDKVAWVQVYNVELPRLLPG